MYHPTSRVLTVLELLQSRPSITGPELAARLEMDVRTVRRYVNHLQDIGIPVEGNIGRFGGYRLRPGFKLPPLMFTEDEATAIMLGLLGTSWLEIGQPTMAVEGAMAKLSRVLPQRARERLNALSEHLFFFSPQIEEKPDTSLLLLLTEAIAQEHLLALDYSSSRQQATHREVKPYAVMAWDGHWYLVGYCCLRQGLRTFRLDRMQDVQILEETFERPEDFEVQKYIDQQYHNRPSGKPMEVEFQAKLSLVQKKIPAQYGKLSETPTGTLFQSQYENADRQMRYLVSLNMPFVVHEPQELRDAMVKLGEQLMQSATAIL